MRNERYNRKKALKCKTFIYNKPLLRCEDKWKWFSKTKQNIHTHIGTYMELKVYYKINERNIV